MEKTIQPYNTIVEILAEIINNNIKNNNSKEVEHADSQKNSRIH
ncbi:MAG: hypothetical protein N4A57_01505 [Anaeromicrobium sp.]|nr:hypothetical protein [Anaeromicrobium sp.]MCT4592942.1 hypothetical protein [Anaeromicrobium sp.]